MTNSSRDLTQDCLQPDRPGGNNIHYAYSTNVFLTSLIISS